MEQKTTESETKTNSKENKDDKTPENSNQEKKNYTDTFPSGKLILSIVQKEYDFELNLKNTLETRSGIFISVAIAMLTFTTSHIKIPTKINITQTHDFLFLLLAFSAFIACLISVFFLLQVLLAFEYKRLDISKFDKKTLKTDEGMIAAVLSLEYQEVLIHNQKMDKQKASRFRIGTYSLIIFLISAVFLFAINI